METISKQALAIWAPGTFKGSTYESLAPSRELKDAYRTEEITAKQFEEIYYETVLSKLDPLTVYNDLKGKILCCWETRRQFCHRHLVIKWLKEELGDNVIGGEL